MNDSEDFETEVETRENISTIFYVTKPKIFSAACSFNLNSNPICRSKV